MPNVRIEINGLDVSRHYVEHAIHGHLHDLYTHAENVDNSLTLNDLIKVMKALGRSAGVFARQTRNFYSSLRSDWQTRSMFQRAVHEERDRIRGQIIEGIRKEVPGRFGIGVRMGGFIEQEPSSNLIEKRKASRLDDPLKDDQAGLLGRLRGKSPSK